MTATILTAKANKFRVRDEGPDVVLVLNGVATVMPPQIARLLARALHAKASRAEEVIEHERIARDHAILMRAGAPFGLTSRPEILREAITAAHHDRDLRRYMPGGVKSREVFGAPTIIVHPPRARKELTP